MPPQREYLDEGVSDDEICEHVSSHGFTGVRRIKVRRNNELSPTNNFILILNVPILPPSLRANNLNTHLIESLIPNPLRFKCQRFEHGQNTSWQTYMCTVWSSRSRQ